MSFWKTFWACFLAIILTSVVGFFFSVLMFVSVIVSISSMVGGEESKISSGSVLTIDLGDSMVETLSDNVIDYMNFSTFEINQPVTLYAMREAIERAAIDSQIEGIFIKIPITFDPTSTMVYELRSALQDFRKQSPNKFIVSYGEAYSQQALYLSSVATDACINPMGAVQWTGMAVMPMFYKKLLDKLGIEAQVIRHGKFKGAIEPYILEKLSAENREQMQSMIDSNWDYMVKEIASSRNLSVEELFKAADNLSISTTNQAIESGLLDKSYYLDEVEKWIDEQHSEGEKARYITLADYALSGVNSSAASSYSNQIEVIYAEGSIVDVSTGSYGEIVGETLAKKIAKARENSRVKAIVLRVNSPGGSAIASEVIGREVRLALEQKPVIISMGEYAASGGYWISASSTKILASPMTLTGSIGVFGLTFSFEKGAEQILGLTVDPVKTSTYGDFGSMMRPLTTLERQVIQTTVNEMYDKFLGNVSIGRDMTTAEVDNIGQGRIWTGLQGLDNGLVDEIGTLNDAIQLAAVEAGVEDNYRVVTTTGKKNSFTQLFGNVSVKLLSKILPFTFTQPMVEYIKSIESENGTVQARFPFELQYNN